MKNIQLKVTVELLYTQHCILYSDMHLSQFINKHETGHRWINAELKTIHFLIYLLKLPTKPKKCHLKLEVTPEVCQNYEVRKSDWINESLKAKDHTM